MESSIETKSQSQVLALKFQSAWLAKAKSTQLGFQIDRRVFRCERLRITNIHAQRLREIGFLTTQKADQNGWFGHRVGLYVIEGVEPAARFRDEPLRAHDALETQTRCHFGANHEVHHISPKGRQEAGVEAMVENKYRMVRTKVTARV